MRYFGIDNISMRLRVPARLIERAVRLGLAAASNEKPPYRFSSAEVQCWNDWEGIGRALRDRLQRNERGEYLGTFLEPGEYVQTHRFRLPFRGRWLVTDGGKAATPDGWMKSWHYYRAPCVRWAWDFGMIHPEDVSKAREGMASADLLALRFRRGQPEDTPDYVIPDPWETDRPRQRLNPEAACARSHYGYGVDVVAPADGVIMTRMGQTDDPSFAAEVEEAKAAADDRQHPRGFLIDHGEDEFSQIAHVLAESITVRPGDVVSQGQVLCKAGGQTFFPHLHWGVWDSWNPLFAQALPVTIDRCLVYEDGDFVQRENVWLERGMIVENLPAGNDDGPQTEAPAADG